MALTPMMFVLLRSGRKTAEIFGECLGGCAACGLLRQISPQSFDRIRTLDASVFC